MAVRSISVTRPHPTNAQVCVWTGLTNASSDTGEPVELFDHADASIQFGGTFGAGGTIVLEGSNDGSTYFTLSDVTTTAISKTAAALVQIAEIARYIRPRVTAGDGTTSLVATLYCRRPR